MEQTLANAPTPHAWLEGMGFPSKYTGPWYLGYKHGNGTATWSDGTVYKGEFKYNKKDGKGKMTNPDGSVYWDGNWKNDQPDR